MVGQESPERARGSLGEEHPGCSQRPQHFGDAPATGYAHVQQPWREETAGSLEDSVLQRVEPGKGHKALWKGLDDRELSQISDIIHTVGVWLCSDCSSVRVLPF